MINVQKKDSSGQSAVFPDRTHLEGSISKKDTFPETNRIITVTDLDYYYGDFKILDNIKLNVNTNSIFGFLGPNGAGKTTTIKILLGLLSAPHNKVYLFGKELRKNRIEILSRTGSLVENPSIYHHLTASENLKILAVMLGIKRTKIDEVLEIVGLSNAGSKKAGSFSTGMKQRLGIAKALLPDPELIILDEPTTGLDPGGIIEIRELLLSLKNDHGKTIFLSSHLLSEIEKICTDVGIINKGKILFQGSMEELNKLNNTHLQVKTNSMEKTRIYFDKRKTGYITISQNTFDLPYRSDQATSGLVKDLVKNGIDIYSVEKKENTLEELFINIIER
ncbi:MAG: ATP-binding cassette domain-containing protein [Chlorobi bacterium]|nr:ATP-binding cassette domain-containing protein [Chlorobiota bacterium]